MAKKAKLSSSTRGHTKARRTKIARCSPNVELGGKKYSVSRVVLKQLQQELEPHLVEEPEELVEQTMSFDEFFGSTSDLPKGAESLKGLRYREDLTQVEFAEIIGVTQANLSAMENGRRGIGKEIAKRIEKAFDIDYRVFL